LAGIEVVTEDQRVEVAKVDDAAGFSMSCADSGSGSEAPVIGWVGQPAGQAMGLADELDQAVAFGVAHRCSSLPAYSPTGGAMV